MICYQYIMILLTILCVGCKMSTCPKMANAGAEVPNYIINENLSQEDYSNIQGYFPSDGFVHTAELAFRIAEPILVDLYGENIIEGQKPFSVNLENNVWMIEGSIKDNIDGGVAYMEINKHNGKILKVIHTK